QSMMSPAIASPPPRPYSSFDSYTTTNTTSGDETDIYFPTLENGTTAENLPAVLLLQGALVDKAFYSDYASQVAQYGFAVSVPNHVQAVPGFGEVLAPDTSKIQVGYNQLVFESTRSASPLAGKVDTDKLGLLGHSLGGAVGLSAIGEVCPPGLCPAPFTRPDALAGGAFFGANLRNENDVFFPISNEGIRRYSQIWCTRQN
ncbi:MAG: alpha/beta hydrolase, partial [Cyanobacteria bacterium J06554_11]